MAAEEGWMRGLKRNTEARKMQLSNSRSPGKEQWYPTVGDVEGQDTRVPDVSVVEYSTDHSEFHFLSIFYFFLF